MRNMFIAFLMTLTLALTMQSSNCEERAISHYTILSINEIEEDHYQITIKSDEFDDSDTVIVSKYELKPILEFHNFKTSEDLAGLKFEYPYHIEQLAFHAYRVQCMLNLGNSYHFTPDDVLDVFAIYFIHDSCPNLKSIPKNCLQDFINVDFFNLTGSSDYNTEWTSNLNKRMVKMRGGQRYIVHTDTEENVQHYDLIVSNAPRVKFAIAQDQFECENLEVDKVKSCSVRQCSRGHLRGILP